MFSRKGVWCCKEKPICVWLGSWHSCRRRWLPSRPSWSKNAVTDTICCRLVRCRTSDFRSDQELWMTSARKRCLNFLDNEEFNKCPAITAMSIHFKTITQAKNLNYKMVMNSVVKNIDWYIWNSSNTPPLQYRYTDNSCTLSSLQQRIYSLTHSLSLTRLIHSG